MDSTKDDGRRRLVGKLIRSYREDSTHGGGMLSQDALLYLMSVHKEINRDEYVHKYDSDDLASWEEGNSPIPNQFVEDFCTALAIGQAEGNSLKGLTETGMVLEDEATDRNPVIAFLKNSMRKLVPPGGYTSLGGLSLSALGFDGAQSLITYVVGLLALVTGLGVWRWRKSGKPDEVVEDLFFVSIFVLLNTGLLGSAITRMDPYGFFTFTALDFGPFLFMLVILLNLALSLAAWSIFVFLRDWLYITHLERTNPFLRAIGTTLPPSLLVYVVTFVLTNPGGWIYNAVLIGIVFGAFFVIMAFRDPEIKLTEWELKWAPIVAIEVIVILCTFGVAGLIATYLEPSLIVATAQHNLLWSWDTGFETLGYPESEFLERFRVAIMWISLSAIIYLSTVLGSYLVVTIRRASVSTPLDSQA